MVFKFCYFSVCSIYYYGSKVLILSHVTQQILQFIQLLAEFASMGYLLRYHSRELCKN